MQKFLKSTLLFLLTTVAISNISAQDVAFPKNEIKTNLLNDLVGIGVLSYERLLNEESGVGVTVGAILFADTEVALAFQPSYRYYFGKKPAAGFFIEGAGILLTQKEAGAQGGVGLTFGTKLLTKKNIVVEGFLGVGRLFIKIENDDFFGSLIYPRVGISIGKRF